MKPSKPYYQIAGESPMYDLPSSAAIKSVGGKIVVGKYYVYHSNKEDERFPWVVKEELPPGKDPSDNFTKTFSQYRDAIRAAKKLDRQHLASQETGGEETKAA